MRGLFPLSLPSPIPTTPACVLVLPDLCFVTSAVFAVVACAAQKYIWPNWVVVVGPVPALVLQHLHQLLDLPRLLLHRSS